MERSIHTKKLTSRGKMEFTEYLEERGMSAIEFSRRIGLAPSTVNRLKKTPANVHAKVMLLVYEYTRGRVTPNDLLGVRAKKPIEF